LAPRIREFNWRTDRDAVVGFQREVYERNFPGFRADTLFLRDYAAQMRRAAGSLHERMWVLDDGGAICGFVWVSLITTMVDASVGYVKNVYISPARRGQGWAKALLAVAEEWFVSQGATKAALDASACNPEAVGLYLDRGYEIVRHRMEKVITPKRG
jgi:ribosomal protein S18 acetylase RimI-like enzyme